MLYDCQVKVKYVLVFLGNRSSTMKNKYGHVDYKKAPKCLLNFDN